jgi:cell wall-associated NlpC family hydrolase
MSVSADVEVVALAKEWLGTPYHHMGRIKGAGVDCAMFPLEVYRAAGLLPGLDIPFYPHDWHLHRSDEIYLKIVESLATEVQWPLAGDFVLYRFGRTWSHGAIVLDWPLIIHAVAGRGVILSDGEREGILVGRKHRFFSCTQKSVAMHQ